MPLPKKLPRPAQQPKFARNPDKLQSRMGGTKTAFRNYRKQLDKLYEDHVPYAVAFAYWKRSLVLA